MELPVYQVVLAAVFGLVMVVGMVALVVVGL
jgi:hypothetical protein